MDEKQIGKYIKDGQFSKLGFLYDKKQLLEHENYYGFLYFLLERKNSNNIHVLNEIEKIKGGLGLAYFYLAKASSIIFDDFHERQITISFLTLASELEPKISEIWYSLFEYTSKSKFLLNGLTIDYKNKKFSNVKSKLKYSHQPFFKETNLSQIEWLKLNSIIEDENIFECDLVNPILVCSYYHIGKYEKGIQLIKSMEYFDRDILSKYHTNGFISEKELISKLHVRQLDSYFKNDHERIYQEYLLRDGKDELNITKFALIKKAFRARKYCDVVFHNSKDSDDDVFYKFDLEHKLYVAISQMCLNESVYEDILKFIQNNEFRMNADIEPLYKVFKFKQSMMMLLNRFNERKDPIYPIAIDGLYQDLKKFLDDSDLINHYLYDDIYNELELFVDRWNEKYFDEKIISIKKEMKNGDLSYDDFIEFCNLGIHKNNYTDVIKQVNEYHQVSEPSIYTYNVLGVCFERQELYIDSYKYYKLAVELMDKYQEYNNIIISNYLLSIEKIKNQIDIDIDYYNLWREKFNTSLLDTFQWNNFTSNIGRRLYKYSPFNLNTLDSLFNRYFYFPEKPQLNDPIEMPLLKNVGVDQLIDPDYRICSFSKNKNSMLMWSHYTQNHEGIMVEYKFIGDLPPNVGVGRVKYSNDGKRNKEQNKFIFNQFLLTKNKEWSYEEEVRLISYKKDKVYYETYQYPNPDKRKINTDIVSITLGCNFDKSKIPLIVNFIEGENKKIQEREHKIKLRQAIISEDNIFGLEYIEIF
ncbi:MAG: DUF2971 domain-containing protein [Vibrio sp.]